MLLVVLSCVTSFWRELFYMESTRVKYCCINCGLEIIKSPLLKQIHDMNGQFSDRLC